MLQRDFCVKSLDLINVLPPKTHWSFCRQVEKEQKFIPYVWTVIVSPVFLHKVSCGWIFPSFTLSSHRLQRWHNEHISWKPSDFCGINNISLPAKILWKPDLTIEEM